MPTLPVSKKKDLLDSEITDKYSDFSPVLVIEIDTKATLEDLTHPEEYYTQSEMV